ncbi:hypothetical protein COB21_00960 [Candidatus Aerophobetes bacterium]|uniref:Peptidase S54 rhomboid domain-containing protein n=1 Tax=Aerophobetes bacterium TaxID=2030807 RepID=A0A2A4X6Y8_UNCAE|nr:MAG: hypothetical protein COB21_00960 [Candidatus Aerophobetes bacterium]
MRLIAKIDDQTKAHAFASFLEREGIQVKQNALLDLSGKVHVEIWIESEDDLEMAVHWYKEFEKNSEDPRFCPSPDEVQIEHKIINFPDHRENKEVEGKTKQETVENERHKRRSVTNVIIALCVFVYLFNAMNVWKEKKTDPAVAFGFTPIFLALSYDVPPSIDQLIEFYNKNHIDSYAKLEKLTPVQEKEFKKVVAADHWKGIYTYFIGGKDAEKSLSGPMFYKIRQGQVYRLISPCFMHGGLLHILFNMLWLAMLGSQIEKRIKIWKYLLLSLILGIISNTAQYLVSGPFFLGYSGIICGLAGFILSRQMVAPWEGYPISRSTFIFLGAYIVLMMVMSLISFFLTKFQVTAFSINIANTAHISGACLGLILGRFSFFSKEVV